MKHPHEESPINPLPPVVILLALGLVVPEMIFQAGAAGFLGGASAIGWRLAALQDYAFIGDVFDQMLQLGLWPLEHLVRFVTYPFVHVSFTHMLFVLVFVLALGKMVGEIFSGWAVATIFFGSSILGALVFALLLDDPLPLVGGFPGAYGLIGAYSFLLWIRAVATGGPQSQAFVLIGFLMGIQLLFGLLFGGGNDWVADIAGFGAGFGLSFLVSPGGWSRVVARLRRR